jgi:hypothetical protein
MSESVDTQVDWPKGFIALVRVVWGEEEGKGSRRLRGFHCSNPERIGFYNFRAFRSVSMKIKWLAHATFLIKATDSNCNDPYTPMSSAFRSSGESGSRPQELSR